MREQFLNFILNFQYDFYIFCGVKTYFAMLLCFFLLSISRLLQIKPEAGNKVLSENSLLKTIPFDEMFLGEEQVQEGKMARIYSINYF